MLDAISTFKLHFMSHFVVFILTKLDFFDC